MGLKIGRAAIEIYISSEGSKNGVSAEIPSGALKTALLITLLTFYCLFSPGMWNVFAKSPYTLFVKKKRESNKDSCCNTHKK